MTLLRKVFLTITRNRSYLLLLGLIFILSQLLFMSYFLGVTNERAVTKVKSQVGPQVVAIVNPEASENGIIPFTKDKMLKISKLTEVAAYDYRTSTQLSSTQIKKVQVETRSKEEAFQFVGIEYPKMVEIETKKMEIIQGRTFTQTEIEQDGQVVIISQELLEANNLQVGDAVVFDYIQYEATTNQQLDNDQRTISSKTPYTFEIIGTYKKAETAELNDTRLPEEYVNSIKDQRANEIFTSNQAIEKIMKESRSEIAEDEFLGNVTFLLNSTDDIDTFIENATTYLPESYMFIGANDASEMIQKSLQSSQDLGQMVMFATVLLSVILLSLILTLIFKQRKREFGIYLALGIKKRGLIQQVIFELYAITIIALLLSLPILNFVIPQITESIIRTELYNTSTTREVPKYGIEVLEIDQSAEAYIEPVIFVSDYVIIAGGVFVIITGSSLILIYRILRYPVKNILLEW